MQSNFDNVRVLVACAHTSRNVTTAHLASFADFCSEGADLIRTGRLAILTQYDPQIDLCRSRFALAASDPSNEFTHLFQFDADMSVSIADLDALLGRGVDVVSGTYFKRGLEPDGREFVCVASRDGKQIARPEIRDYATRNELIPVHGTGGGCLLTSVKALRAVGQPAFKFDFHVGGDWFYRHGEDSYFCDRVRNAGIDVWMDPCVIPFHIGEIRVGMDVMDGNGKPFYTPNY